MIRDQFRFIHMKKTHRIQINFISVVLFTYLKHGFSRIVFKLKLKKYNYQLPLQNVEHNSIMHQRRFSYIFLLIVIFYQYNANFQTFFFSSNGCSTRNLVIFLNQSQAIKYPNTFAIHSQVSYDYCQQYFEEYLKASCQILSDLDLKIEIQVVQNILDKLLFESQARSMHLQVA